MIFSEPLAQKLNRLAIINSATYSPFQPPPPPTPTSKTTLNGFSLQTGNICFFTLCAILDLLIGSCYFTVLLYV